LGRVWQASILPSRTVLVAETIEHRVAAFDEGAANAAAVPMAERRSGGLVGELRDTKIPGIVIANHAIVATRDTGG
jgi:hypothetical protein